MSGMRPPLCDYQWPASAEGIHVCGGKAGHVGRHKCWECPASQRRPFEKEEKVSVRRVKEMERFAEADARGLVSVKAPRGSRVEQAHPLARQLRNQRLEAGLTQTDVARLVGVTTGSISGYENGQRDPSLAVLTRWADALGLKVTLTGGAR